MDILWKLINSSTNLPITGGAASTAVTIRRGVDGYLFDFSDATFKASGWGAKASAMTEIDAVNLPGCYILSISIATWINGDYQVIATYSGTPALYATAEISITGGIVSVTVGTNNDKTGYVLASFDFPFTLDSAYDAAKTAATQTSVDELTTDVYNLTHNEAGDPIVRVIPLPAASHSCVIYDFCFDRIGSTPLPTVTATARIINLPYDYEGKYHSGATITGTYDASQGLVSWEFVWGAVVTISISEIGFLAQVTVPVGETQARIADLV